MTIHSLLTLSPHEDAAYLLSHVLHQPREFVIAHPEYKLTLFQVWHYKKCVQQRKKNIPLAYITGHKEFYGLDFLVNTYTLIPRPETEILVEAVVQTVHVMSPVTYIDVGTGSGCIPTAVFTACKKIHPGMIQKIAASDVSSGALKVAKKNATTHHIPLQFFAGSLLTPFENKNFFSPTETLIISANLPYLTQKQFDEEPSLMHEPYTALVTEEQGLMLYRKLFEQLNQLQKEEKIKKCFVFCEIDPSQTEALTLLVKKNFPLAHYEIIKDWREHERVMKISL